MSIKIKKITDIIPLFEAFFSKFPSLPAGKVVLVTIIPWIALLFGILGVIAGVSMLFAFSERNIFYVVQSLLSLTASVFMLMAYPKLIKRQYKGWELLFWSEVLSVLGSLIIFSLSALVGFVISFLLGFYLLFQIKQFYK